LTRNSDDPANETASNGVGDTCVVVHPKLRAAPVGGARTADARLAEAAGLARAVGLDVVHEEVVAIPRVRPATLFGAGTVERLSTVVETFRHHEAARNVVLVNGPLTPIQQRNLEKAWDCKVVDRTGIILEIFGARAQTAEGRLQVELASLTYQRSRLVRTWTHLERQRGGGGFMAGPGEAQIETDRRLIDERLARLGRQLKEVRRTRALHRQARQRVPYPVIALVGYTNAGKSTLFNRLTRASVAVRDQVFQTLDPTMRQLTLPSGRTAILSDTVGFISDLPHELVDAFRATLEEVAEADLLLHVRDAAHPESDDQRNDVLAVLTGLGLGEAAEQRMIEVFNKADLVTSDQFEPLINRAARADLAGVVVSARTRAGCDALLDLLDERLAADSRLLDVTVPVADGATLAWLYERGEVMDRSDEDGVVKVTVRLTPADAERFARRDGVADDAAPPASQG